MIRHYQYWLLNTLNRLGWKTVRRNNPEPKLCRYWARFYISTIIDALIYFASLGFAEGAVHVNILFGDTTPEEEKQMNAH